MSEVIGFVGLGGMGRRMSARLVGAGFEVHGYDVSPDAVAAAAESGVIPAASLGELASATTSILMSLPNSTVVDSVIFGDGGLVPGLAEGSLIVDLSSGSPTWVKGAVERLAGHGVRYVDVPVSGGFPGSENGTLTLMAGGADADVAEATRLTAPLGTLSRVGEVGAGHLAKALNNALYACALCISAEALVAGKLWGLEPAALVDVWASSSGRNGAIDGRIRNNVLKRDFSGAMAAELMLKDIRHAIELGAELGLEMQWAKDSAASFEKLIDEQGGAVVDFAVVQVWEQQAGVTIE
jgi:3-hydroxyisobutyrate dehydrogenase